MNDLEGSRRVLEELQRCDFTAFLAGACTIVSPGQPLVWGWHLDAMAHVLNMIERGRSTRLVINVPPRHLKSITASVAWSAFLLGRDPTRRIIGVSYSAELARKHANDTRRLMRSSWYRRLFPATIISPDKDTELEFDTTQGGGRFATSTGGTLTGRGGDIIVLDDPMKAQDASSDPTRERVHDWFANTLQSRLDDKVKGAIVLVMQRLHPDDLAGRILEAGGWDQLCLPAIAEEPQTVPLGRRRQHQRAIGEALHPEREPLATLEAIRRDMGSFEFAAQYQQSPVQPGGNLIKWKWFQTYDKAPQILPGDGIVVSWDTALSEGRQADYSVGIVLQTRGDGFYILDVVRERLGFPALKARVTELHQRWSHVVSNYQLLIEKSAAGMSLIQELKTLNIYAKPVEVIGDKIARMNGPSARIESGAVAIPDAAPWLDEFKRELMAFPGGRHDDQVDALSQAINYISVKKTQGQGGSRPIQGHS